MTTAISTLEVPVRHFGTAHVPVQVFDLRARIMASVMIGIEQAKRNEGTLLTDADLAKDDDV